MLSRRHVHKIWFYRYFLILHYFCGSVTGFQQIFHLPGAYILCEILGSRVDPVLCGNMIRDLFISYAGVSD